MPRPLEEFSRPEALTYEKLRKKLFPGDPECRQHLWAITYISIIWPRVDAVTFLDHNFSLAFIVGGSTRTNKGTTNNMNAGKVNQEIRIGKMRRLKTCPQTYILS